MTPRPTTPQTTDQKTTTVKTLTHNYDRAALARFELFLFASVATVLVTRGYLAAMGYPQIGGGGLHVAHVLWGGLLMAVAIVMTAITEGSRIRDRASLIGGIGFGLFIDEVGKFVTSDVNYFYQPAIAIMYVVFVLFYLATREVVIRRGMKDRHRLAIGARALSDLALGQLDAIRYRHALRVLDGVQDPELADLAGSIKTGLHSHTPTGDGIESRLTNWRNSVSTSLDAFLGHRIVRRIVLALFIVEALGAVATAAVSVFTKVEIVAEDVSDLVVILSSATSTILVILGVWFLLRDRYLRALRLLRASIVISLLVTQVYLFTENQFGALIGFGISLFMLGVLRVTIRTEESAAEAAPDRSVESHR
ncbi:hypothetical protein [Rhodococcus sp. IEGM 1379]|uniref:hypothetical protein n=1 Tax=Rhodococcus sp. IEGM 1379 TaxID=3047086 RepID=UPI0024B7E200|nr:hypothetical protein [Rhodococcus sp. IEGM 1379]MDI9915156.1 hypothetical protein [Rhodococcus sp. IEGM 1379]